MKSLRAGKATIAESYADARDGEIWLINSNIPEYLQANRFNHAPKRPRKLLLHKRQINKLVGAVEREGMTLVPLKLYFNEKGRAKLELRLARGKKLYDKRETEKKRILGTRTRPAVAAKGVGSMSAAGQARPLRDPRLRLGALERVLHDVLGAELVDAAGRLLPIASATSSSMYMARASKPRGGAAAGRARQQRFLFRMDGADRRRHRPSAAPRLAIERGPMQRFGAKGAGTSVYFRDPDGSLMEFMSYARGSDERAEKLRAPTIQPFCRPTSRSRRTTAVPAILLA